MKKQNEDFIKVTFANYTIRVYHPQIDKDAARVAKFPEFAYSGGTFLVEENGKRIMGGECENDGNGFPPRLWVREGRDNFDKVNSICLKYLIYSFPIICDILAITYLNYSD